MAEAFTRSTRAIMTHPSPLDLERQRMADLGGPEAVYEVDLIALVQRLTDVPDAATPLLQLVNGRRTVQAVLEAVRTARAEAVATFAALARIGVLRPPGGQAPAPPLGPVIVPKLSSVSLEVDTWGDDPEILQIPVLGE